MGGLFASLIGTLALNGYIIVSAVWMAKLHRDELANNAEIENESAVLNNLIYASKIEFEKKSNKSIKFFTYVSIPGFFVFFKRPDSFCFYGTFNRRNRKDSAQIWSKLL
jgi:hypothetical protein